MNANATNSYHSNAFVNWYFVMKAVGLKKDIPGLFLEDIAKPEIQKKDDVLIRIISTAIDGTDFSLLKNHLVDAPEKEDFLTLGHEMIGRVEAVGSGVHTIAVGDLVTPTNRRGCGICSACAENMSDYCYTGLYKEHGIHFLHGYLTEYAVSQEQYCVKMSEEDIALGVWVEPMSIAIKAFDEMLRIQLRAPSSCIHPEHNWDQPRWQGCKRALVLGAGPLGFLGTLWLRAHDIETYVLEVVPEDSIKVKMIKKLGAHYVDGKSFTPKKIMEAIGHVDVIFEATGASDVALAFIEMMSRNSVYLLMGVPRAQENKVCFDVNAILRHIVRQNQVILGSVNSNAEHFRKAAEFLRFIQKRFPGMLEKGITNRFALEQFEEAFSFTDGERLKIVFDISKP